MHKIIYTLNKKKNPRPSEEKDQVNIFSELTRFLEQKVIFFSGVYIILGRGRPDKIQRSDYEEPNE